MKKLILTIIFIYSSTNALCQWQWAKQIGGPDFDGGGTSVDKNNNLYCRGVFASVCYFENDTLYPLGDNDIFLSKYDANANELWVKRIGGNNPPGYSEWSGGFTIDNINDCIYFSGKFYGVLTIDTETITSNGMLDIFLAKFDLNGNCIWLKKAGSSLNDGTSVVTVDSSGIIYWTGVLGSNGILDSTNLSKGTFLAKLDEIGNLVWVKNEMIGGYPGALNIKNDEIYFCGVTTNDTAIIDTLTLISTSGSDCILGKLNSSGSVIWAKRFGGYSSDYAINFNLDSENNFFVVGQFNDSIIVDADTLTNNGKSDLFFAKFDSIGNLIWIRQSGSDGSLGAKAYSIIEDGEGTFYIGGYFNGNAWFGSFNVSSSISTSKDMFIARYDSSGECLGIRHFGEAETFNIQIENSGSLVISGDFSNTVNIGNTTLTSHGDIDMFFAKTDAFTGIGEIGERQSNQLLIYANPTQGTCNITIPDDFKHEKNLTLSIYDNTGKLIQQGSVEMNEEKVRVNLEAEAKGIYNVTLSNGKKSYGGKIVFE